MMNYKPQNLQDVFIIEPIVYKDNRGFFMETFRKNQFKDHCGDYDFVQDNHSRSRMGALRGLHCQVGNPQGKLARVTQGEVLDVIVDCRKNSSTFGKWESFILSDKNNEMLWIPPGFAHGFIVTSESADFQYKCTNYYDPESEFTILWNDRSLKINWPNVDAVKEISAKDRNGKPFIEFPFEKLMDYC